MSSRLGFVSTTTFVGAFAGFPLTSIAFTTPPLTLAYDGQQVVLIWYLRLTSGATGPLVSYDLRRGPLVTSPLVTASSAGVTEVGSVALQRSGCFVDTNSGAGTPQYSLTCTVSNAASNGAYNEGILIAMAL
jgi:hypothetical protein